MPEALFLALPVVGGYVATISLNATRYRAMRDTGYRLYFKIIQYGLILGGIAIVVVQIVWATSAMLGAAAAPGPIPEHLAQPIRAGLFSTAVNHRWHAAILAFALGHVVRFFNTYSSKQKAIEAAIEDQDFELMVAASQREDKPILATMRSGKVYLGWATRGPNPELARRWVRLLPLASGYRDDTHRVVFTVNYAPILDKVRRCDASLPKGITLQEFEVVLSVDAIIGMHLFNVDIYGEFDSAGASLFASPDAGRPQGTTATETTVYSQHVTTGQPIGGDRNHQG